MDLENFAKHIFDSQPFSKFIDAKLLQVQSDQTVIGIDLQLHHLQQHGIAHGGVISYLADNAITFAGGLSVQGNALTSEFKINYVKPAKGERIICEASAVAYGKRQAVCTAKVFIINNDTKILCAIAQGTVVKSS